MGKQSLSSLPGIPICLAYTSLPSGSNGKEPACSAGDLGLISGSGRSLGEGNGNPLSILAWRIPWTEQPDRLHAVLCFSCSVVSKYLQPHELYLPGSSIHGIFQARLLAWVAISFSRGSSQPSNQTWVSCIAGESLSTEPLGKQVSVNSC